MGFQNVCRVCETTNDLEEIYSEKNAAIAHMLRSITPLLIERDDNRIKYICLECIENLKETYDLKSICLLTFNKYKKMCSANSVRKKTKTNTSVVPPISYDAVELLSSLKMCGETTEHRFENDGDPIIPQKNNGYAFTFNEQMITNIQEERGESVSYSGAAQLTPINPRNIGIGPNICQRCGKTYHEEIDLTDDNEILSPKESKFCKDCEKILLSSVDLNSYNGLNSDADIKQQCGQLLEDASKFLPPLPSLEGGQYVCTINNCGKSFRKLVYYEKHVPLHFNPDLNKCDECGKSFNSPEYLKAHKRLHINPDLFQCKYCGKSLTSPRSLREHEALHVNPDLYKCEQCGKSFSGRGFYQNHVARHLNTVRYDCTECGKSFKSPQYWRLHKKLHTNPDLFQCKHCGKALASRKCLNEHEALHQNPLESNCLHKCDECGKAFKSWQYWKMHKQLHENPELLQCKFCGKSFTSRSRFNEHESYHVNPDLYKCEECGRTFSCKQSYKRHKALHL